MSCPPKLSELLRLWWSSSRIWAVSVGRKRVNGVQCVCMLSCKVLIEFRHWHWFRQVSSSARCRIARSTFVWRISRASSIKLRGNDVRIVGFRSVLTSAWNWKARIMSVLSVVNFFTKSQLSCCYIYATWSRIQLSYTGFGNFTGDEKASPNVQISDYFYHLISLCAVCTVTFYVSLWKPFSFFVHNN